VKPLPGHNIWDWDYSQIEYRLIAHYTNNKRAIKAYNDDPLMDFHDWVAELAGIPRKPAKTLNFRLAYGSGKPGAVKSLICLLADEINKEVDDLIGGRLMHPDDRVGLFQSIFQERGGNIYDKYHAFQPELKKTLDKAAEVAGCRGYIKTIGGRRSYIPPKLSYKALNYVVQGSAADIMKNRMIAASPRYNPVVRAFGVKPFAVVHDDTPQHAPQDVDEKDYMEYTKKILEDVPYEIKVPILVSGEKHEKNWLE
jgi:DNA polymerase-1